MRMMMKVNIPNEAGNAAMRNGTFAGTMQKILESMKPEAAYFVEDNGERTAFIFFEMTDSSQIPAFAEPLFLAFNAKLTLKPAMNTQDLAKAFPAIDQAAKTFG
jgi:hypothetical protein